MKQTFTLDFEGRTLTVETGEIAKQADGAVLVRFGDTVTLSTACCADKPKGGDFFPLTVDYIEKQYAAGKIPQSFLRREGRPDEHGILSARLIDRPIRPLFAEGFRNEVQIVNTVMSVDRNNTPEMTAMFGASLALCISDIPFDGPVAGVYVGRVNGELVIDPNEEQKAASDINLAVAGTENAIMMIEAGAAEVPEEEIQHLIYTCDFMGLSSAYVRLYKNGTAEQRQMYVDRAEDLRNYIEVNGYSIEGDDVYTVPEEIDYSTSLVYQFYDMPAWRATLNPPV